MSEDDRVKALVKMVRDPKSDAKTRLDAASELLDMCDPKYVAELARLYVVEALEALKEIIRITKDPDVKRQAEQQLEEAEKARQAYMRTLH